MPANGRWDLIQRLKGFNDMTYMKMEVLSDANMYVTM